MENSKYYKIKNIEKKYSSTWYDWLINYIPFLNKPCIVEEKN